MNSVMILKKNQGEVVHIKTCKGELETRAVGGDGQLHRSSIFALKSRLERIDATMIEKMYKL